MSQATSKPFFRRKSGILAVVLVAVVLGVTLVPFSYTRTVGYTVSFAVPADQPFTNPNDIVSALATLGIEDVSANFSSDGVKTNWTLSGLADEQAANTAAAAFRTLTGTTDEPDIVPVRKEVSGTLYAQVREQLQEITVSVDDAASPEEIEAQIRDQLIAAGFTPANVHVETSDDGGSTITIDLSTQ